jgi:hypothetical protein
MNITALLAAYKVVKEAYPIIKTVATMIDNAMPDSPAKTKAEAGFAMLAHAVDEFKTITPELQVAFNGAISLYKAEKAIAAGLKGAPAAAAT